MSTSADNKYCIQTWATTPKTGDLPQGPCGRPAVGVSIGQGFVCEGHASFIEMYYAGHGTVQRFEDKPETHPVQTPHMIRRDRARIRTEVTLRAYEVYCAVYKPQPAMVTGECRGGFSTGELIAFLYAHTFPKQEWARRVREAYIGMENL